MKSIPTAAVYLQSVEALPTWVNMRTDGAKQYNILPLDEDKEDQWAELFNLNDAMLSSAKKSMERTDSIVGAGMEKCRTYLEQQKADREAYYQDLASHPETYVPSTVPEETASGKPPRKPPPSPLRRHNKPYPTYRAAANVQFCRDPVFAFLPVRAAGTAEKAKLSREKTDRIH